ncbi:MAG: S-methyl-5-thioribose-1-phosphate isomerase [Thermoprotei archaeon]|jgi:S-methyl-5-thioribose-1-phosphate isomerase
MSEVIPIHYEKGELSLLDQRLLPFKETWVKCHDARETAEAIRDMVVRGAPAIGVAAAYGAYMEIAKSVNNGLGIEGAKDGLDALLSSRPTAYNLFYAVNRVLSAAKGAYESGRDPVIAAETEAKHIDEENRQAAIDMGKIGATLINDGDTVMTICNTGALAVGYLGTALGVIKTAWREGKKIHVISLETRPWLQGSRLTVYELQKEGIPFTLIVDGASAITIQRRGVRSIFVGADRIVEDGSTANKIGTFSLSIIARYFGIPFYVVAPLSTVQLGTKDIKVEERPPEEVTQIRGVQISTAGENVYNPVFDVTPPENITAIVTEKGIATPPYEQSLRALKAGSKS